MNLSLTLDYELWGDGSGNVFQQIIEPTQKILNACDENNIKITIFFEAIEYLKLKEEWDKGNSMGYDKDPVEAIEKQIINAAQNGHDIQLHVHPQWVQAKYINNRWNVDFANWRLGDFEVDFDYSIEDLLRDGKKTLEKLIAPVAPGYECIALRAGGFNIMPSKAVYLAMKNLGLKIDSSVFPGGYENGYLSRFDYRNVLLGLDFWWANSDDITKVSENKKEVLEIPIYSLKQYRWKRILNFQKIKRLLFNKHATVTSVVKDRIYKKSLPDKLRFVLEKEALTWDFCLFSTSMHKKYLNFIERNLIEVRKSFILIGHAKSLEDDNVFRSFIELTRKRRIKYTFKTLKELYSEFTQERIT